MSLVKNLMQSSQGAIDTTALENSFGDVIHEGFLDDAFVEMATGLCSLNEAYYTADIIGTCRVLTEGADATALMESMVSSGISKLINLWNRLLAKIRAFFTKAVQLVKSMFLTGKKFVDTFGKQIREKAKTKFKMSYKGYKYDPSGGQKLFSDYAGGISKAMDELVGGLNDAGNSNADVIYGKIKAKKAADRKSASEYTEDVIGGIASGCNYVSDLKEKITEKYRNGETSASDHDLAGSEVGAMLDYIASAKTSIDILNRNKKDMERVCTNVINKLKSIEKPKDGESQDKYETANAISQYLNSLLAVYRAIVGTNVSMVREVARSYTGIMRKFLNASGKKLAAEGVIYEGDEDVDIDDEDIELDEAAIAGADEPEGDAGDIGVVREGCGKKCATEEGCSSDKDPLEEAMMYL